jgi:hypothetical protein
VLGGNNPYKVGHQDLQLVLMQPFLSFQFQPLEVALPLLCEWKYFISLNYFAIFHFHRHSHLLFWNQIFTCVSVSRRDEENSARSAMLKYCFSRNFFSSESNCCVVKGVRGLRFGLCFLKLHFKRGNSFSVNRKEGKFI